MFHQLSAGRFPWFNSQGKSKDPYIIGIGGGSASGKTSVSLQIISTLNVPWIVLISMDSFYKALSPEQKASAHRNEYNFDHPNAFDFDLLYQTLVDLKKGLPYLHKDVYSYVKGIKVQVPIYDFTTHSRTSKTSSIYGANVVIFEGIFALYDAKIRQLMDLMLFVDTDSDVRLARRLKRDIAERGRDLPGVLDQYNKFVKPAFDKYIFPSMNFADIIIPRGTDNQPALDLIMKHVFRQLNDRGITLKNEISNQEDWKSKPLPLTVTVFEPKPHLKHLLTILIDKNTSREDFVFYSDQLTKMLMEKACSCLPFTPISIMTPANHSYDGFTCQVSVCSVSIVRSGTGMERALRKVFQDAPIGKLLIQTNPSIGEPQLHYCKLPRDVHKRFVFLNDAQIRTGAAALMAIRVLLDHHVPQEQIIFTCFQSSTSGIHLICKAFPLVKIVACQIYNDLSNDFSDFGDRYYGTF